ncbi:hypothetical protein SAMN05444273_101298 [Litoreibacter ascidiaceicola]|uniref:Uncharacterized protein n=1 Tax=Litoreibacter ascidiaceicola TaxID=1486859 RepID=A0A1M4T452_9RHOB|nr:hypothetical protein [Litoreibacter ascidiaceicola]SHE39272.1 hypothetical protein SAMN05444273_101298 [Litoreibacter ascidiaceicola]
MTKLLEQMANLLPAPLITLPEDSSVARPILTRDEVEVLFSRELGRQRFH